MKFKAKVAAIWYGYTLTPGREIDLDGVYAEKAQRMPAMFELVAEAAEDDTAPAKRGPGRPRKVTADENPQ